MDLTPCPSMTGEVGCLPSCSCPPVPSTFAPLLMCPACSSCQSTGTVHRSLRDPARSLVLVLLGVVLLKARTVGGAAIPLLGLPPQRPPPLTRLLPPPLQEATTLGMGGSNAEIAVLPPTALAKRVRPAPLNCANIPLQASALPVCLCRSLSSYSCQLLLGLGRLHPSLVTC